MARAVDFAQNQNAEQKPSELTLSCALAEFSLNEGYGKCSALI